MFFSCGSSALIGRAVCHACHRIPARRRWLPGRYACAWHWPRLLVQSRDHRRLWGGACCKPNDYHATHLKSGSGKESEVARVCRLSPKLVRAMTPLSVRAMDCNGVKHAKVSLYGHWVEPDAIHVGTNERICPVCIAEHKRALGVNAYTTKCDAMPMRFLSFARFVSRVRKRRDRYCTSSAPVLAFAAADRSQTVGGTGCSREANGSLACCSRKRGAWLGRLAKCSVASDPERIGSYLIGAEADVTASVYARRAADKRTLSLYLPVVQS